jgi:hypothetical protein
MVRSLKDRIDGRKKGLNEIIQQMREADGREDGEDRPLGYLAFFL